MFIFAWTNGKPRPTGSGYGLRLRKEDRAAVVDPAWTSVELILTHPGEEPCVVNASVPPSFWRDCPHFKSREIGRWFLRHRFAPWPYRQPTQFRIEVTGPGQFTISLAA